MKCRQFVTFSSSFSYRKIRAQSGNRRRIEVVTTIQCLAGWNYHDQRQLVGTFHRYAQRQLIQRIFVMLILKYGQQDQVWYHSHSLLIYYTFYIVLLKLIIIIQCWHFIMRTLNILLWGSVESGNWIKSGGTHRYPCSMYNAHCTLW